MAGIGAASTDAKVIVAAINELKKAVEASNPNLQDEKKMRLERYVKNQATENAAISNRVFPVRLDWTSPVALRGKARVIYTDDDRIEFRVVVDGPDAAIAHNLLRTMNVEALQLSVVKPG